MLRGELVENQWMIHVIWTFTLGSDWNNNFNIFLRYHFMIGPGGPLFCKSCLLCQDMLKLPFSVTVNYCTCKNGICNKNNPL